MSVIQQSNSSFTVPFGIPKVKTIDKDNLSYRFLTLNLMDYVVHDNIDTLDDIYITSSDYPRNIKNQMVEILQETINGFHWNHSNKIFKNNTTRVELTPCQLNTLLIEKLQIVVFKNYYIVE